SGDLAPSSVAQARLDPIYSLIRKHQLSETNMLMQQQRNSLPIPLSIPLLFRCRPARQSASKIVMPKDFSTMDDDFSAPKRIFPCWQGKKATRASARFPRSSRA